MTDLEFLIETPNKPVANLLLLHGAGAPMNSGFMQLLSDALVAEQPAAHRVNFAYPRPSLHATIRIWQKNAASAFAKVTAGASRIYCGDAQANSAVACW